MTEDEFEKIQWSAEEHLDKLMRDVEDRTNPDEWNEFWSRIESYAAKRRLRGWKR